MISLPTDMAAFGFAAYFAHLEQSFLVPEWILQLFWLFYVLVDVVVLNGVLHDATRGYSWQLDTHAKLLVTRLVFLLCAFYLSLQREEVDYFEQPQDENEQGRINVKLEEYLNQVMNPSPEIACSVFNRVWFFWLNPLMKKGHEGSLELDDLVPLIPSDASKITSALLEEEIKLSGPGKRSLVWSIFRTFGTKLVVTGFYKVINDMLSFSQPQLLAALLAFASSYTSPSPDPLYNGVLISIGMLLASLIQAVFIHQYYQGCFRLAMKIDSSLVNQVYKKSLRLSNKARLGYSVGEITNLMAVDSSRLGDLCEYLHNLWSSPFQILLAIYFLHRTLGVAVYAGVFVMILMIPINAYVATTSRSLNKKQMGNRDARQRMMDEILSGIKVVKLNAWQAIFADRVNKIREMELSTLKSIGYLNSVTSLLWSITPFLVSLVAFSVYSLVEREPLTSEKIFVSLALFNLLGFPLTTLPSVIAACIEASVSINRLTAFLSAPERMQYLHFLDKKDGDVESMAVVAKVTAGSFGWTQQIHSQRDDQGLDTIEIAPTLTDISFQAHFGQLVAVVGQVGAGKSSLLSALLGDMYLYSGNVSIKGSVAYVPQTAWIMNATVRDNILFGNAFNKKKYEMIIEACGLVPDLEQFAAGDMTEIGERGISLSGGMC